MPVVVSTAKTQPISNSQDVAAYHDPQAISQKDDLELALRQVATEEPNVGVKKANHLVFRHFLTRSTVMNDSCVWGEDWLHS
jgi:hypothetical protein